MCHRRHRWAHRSEALKQESLSLPPGLWETVGLSACGGVAGTAWHPSFSPSPSWLSPPPLAWVWLSSPPTQALTWAGGCWFTGEAGRLCSSPSMSIQYLLFPACQDAAPRSGAGKRLVPSSDIRPLLGISHELCLRPTPPGALAGGLTGMAPGAFYPQTPSN